MQIQRLGQRNRKIRSPFEEFTDEKLIRRYPFDRHGLRVICKLVEEEFSETTYGGTIPIEIQVCAGLAYLASNSFQIHIGDTLGISQQSVSRMLQRNSVFSLWWLVFYTWLAHRWNTVHIQASSQEVERQYVNRKNRHSINVQIASFTNWLRPLFSSIAYSPSPRLVLVKRCMASTQTAKIIANNGEWKSKITSQFVLEGNCKSLNELQIRNVHEYGGGSLCVNDQTSSVFICHKGGIYELAKPLADPRPVVQMENMRHADPFISGDYIYAVQERHSPEDPHAEPENLLVRVNISSGLVDIVAQGADFYAEPRVSPDGKSLVWIQWNKPYMYDDHDAPLENLWVSSWILTIHNLVPSGAVFTYLVRHRRGKDPRHRVQHILFYPLLQMGLPGLPMLKKPLFMPWDETSVHMLQISSSGELGKPKKLLEGGSFFGVQWNSSTSELYVVADVTGFWNVYTVDVEQGSLKQNVYPMDSDIGGPLWQFADDRPFALSATGVVLAVDEDLVYKTCESAKPMESVRQAGFTVFSFLTVSHNKLFSIATGPKHSLSLIEVDLETFEIHPDVKELDLTRTRSKKIEGLDHLKKINSLCFRWNLLSKIENLSNLVTLTELDLYDNQILLQSREENYALISSFFVIKVLDSRIGQLFGVARQTISNVVGRSEETGATKNPL